MDSYSHEAYVDRLIIAPSAEYIFGDKYMFGSKQIEDHSAPADATSKNPLTDSQNLAEKFREDCFEFSKNPKIGSAPILDDVSTARAGGYMKDFAAALREQSSATIGYNAKNEPTSIEFRPTNGGGTVDVDLLHNNVRLEK